MENNEIKSECELQYAQIKKAEERLKEIRTICKHENTFEGNWQWDIASTFPALICSDCGTMVKFIDFEWEAVHPLIENKNDKI